jgi:hypothetical protein
LLRHQRRTGLDLNRSMTCVAALNGRADNRPHAPYTTVRSCSIKVSHGLSMIYRNGRVDRARSVRRRRRSAAYARRNRGRWRRIALADPGRADELAVRCPPGRRILAEPIERHSREST